MTTDKTSAPQPRPRYAAHELTAFANTLLQQAGLAPERAGTVAEILVEADLLGHSTHGLQLLPTYLKNLEEGAMRNTGEPIVVADTGAAITWDGQYLPGPWLMQQAMNLGFERIQQHPVVTVVMRRSHHIACLAAYPKQATDRGLLMVLASADPSVAAVAPYGSTQPVYTPDPVAAGIPTQGDPIILDISLSTTAMGVVNRCRRQQQRLPHPWLLDSNGQPTDDPSVMSGDPPGSVQPLGGLDLGYKGFALGLLVEALTAALGGEQGRADHPTNWGASIFLQLIDPAAFGGRDYFVRETEWLAETCRQSPPIPGHPPVRLPGQRALQLRAEQLEHGVELYPGIMPALQPWSDRFEVALPAPLP
jgi:LDH2 family malate/lactate/ureidoglycolate dehydrogenase